jgi:hypothetical protein
MFSIKKISLLLIVFGILIASPCSFTGNNALAGTTYGKEMTIFPEYQKLFKSSIHVMGVKVPIGISIEYKGDLIGHPHKCSWAFATCDNSKVKFVPL